MLTSPLFFFFFFLFITQRSHVPMSVKTRRPSRAGLSGAMWRPPVIRVSSLIIGLCHRCSAIKAVTPRGPPGAAWRRPRLSNADGSSQRLARAHEASSGLGTPIQQEKENNKHNKERNFFLELFYS